jgi:hypothetical protein
MEAMEERLDRGITNLCARLVRRGRLAARSAARSARQAPTNPLGGWPEDPGLTRPKAGIDVFGDRDAESPKSFPAAGFNGEAWAGTCWASSSALGIELFCTPSKRDKH